ncbi:Pathogen-related protein [Pseudolycoriella hygida]|uniref:Pathogen-related protein n=1 Tax=Pseudolycoriella hygida TaxID=35572 RepID=A0A9Q0N9N0_9DIPT|nr:Pathogen-related protein [Pseudolycoriella hygida]
MESVDNYPDFVKDMNAVLQHVDCEWLNGAPPDYTLSNELYLKERLKVHMRGSLPDKVNNLIKNWERELSYKTNVTEWKTVVPTFRISVNGGAWLTIPDLLKIGAYNAFIGDSEFYCASRVSDPRQSHKIFRTALGSGFGWECLETYSELPTIVFKWRHWGNVTGEFKCPMRNGRDVQVSPIGNRVEIFGISKILVNKNFQIVEMENYFRPDQMMEQIIKGSTDQSC